MREQGLLGVIKCAWILLALLLASGCRVAEEAFEAISAEAFDGHIRFLADDVLEGRGPGSRGAQLAALYIANHFALAGLEPGAGAAGYFQQVPLVSSRPTPGLAFRARGGARYQPAYLQDYVAWAGSPLDSTIASGELIFAGYGISAPEWDWDDFKGTDVTGSVLLFLVNDPGEFIPETFRGDTLTYFGHWKYKFEEAARRGAAGALLIHRGESAAYSWNVVKSSWSGARLSLDMESGSSRLAMEGWLSREAAEQVLSMAGFDFETLLESARSLEFRPLSTGVAVTGRVRSEVSRLGDSNVAGLLRGSDPDLADEVVLITSHYDHLGIGLPVDSDSIYNGAYDNASGTALLLILADAFARLRERPKRSLLFLALTAGESGLLGSRHYTSHPLFPLARTVASINVDGVNLWGRTQDIAVIGAELSSLIVQVAAAADAEGLRLEGDRAPEQGNMYRSDQFSFMLARIPSVYIEHGLNYIGRMPGWGDAMRDEFISSHYHQPSDEYSSDLDYDGAVQQARVVFRVVLDVANAVSRPVWRDDASSFAGSDSSRLGGTGLR